MDDTYRSHESTQTILGMKMVTGYYSKLAGYTFKLGADIDLSAYAWEPIGDGYSHPVKTTFTYQQGSSIDLDVYYYSRFGGNFSGEGHTITGMYVDGNIAKEAGESGYESKTSYGGLFGYIYGEANITHLVIENSYVTSTGHSGAVVACATGQNKEKHVMIDNCHSEATVSGQDRAAGIVGLVENGDVYWCFNYGRVNSNGSECSVGGILASAEGTDSMPIQVHNCVNYGDVYSPYGTNVGGIVGWSEWVNIQTCANYGIISGQEDVGGIIGQVNDSGHLTYANVVDCVNYGEVYGSGNHVGGIAGYVLVGRIVNSANFGRIKGGSSCVGGITGEHDENKNCKTINCVSYGITSGADKYIGSIIGRNYDNKGIVGPVYYKTGGPYAAGTKNGSSNSVDNVTAYSFKTPDSTHQSNLNGWSGFEGYEATEWVKDDTGYGYIPESVYALLYEQN